MTNQKKPFCCAKALVKEDPVLAIGKLLRVESGDRVPPSVGYEERQA
jgi:hypothetical protein